LRPPSAVFAKLDVMPRAARPALTRLEDSMRKMIMMAIAGLLWKKFGGKMAQRYPMGRRSYRRF
jgi:hypothetical protein